MQTKDKPTSLYADLPVRTERFPLWLMATLVIFGCLMIAWQRIICGDIAYTGDTMSYFNAWNLLKTFHPDYFRTPTYPFILRAVYGIFDTKTANLVLQLLQWGVWIAGCRWTWLVLRYLTVNRIISDTVVILLMAFPGCWIFNNCILTECWATGFMPLLVLQLIRYRQTRKRSTIIQAGILMFAMVYLKPQLMFLVVLWGIAWGVTTFGDKRRFQTVMLITALVAGSLMFYKWSMHKCYLQNNFSIVSPRNNYCSLRMAGLIYVEEIENPSAREILREYIETDPGTDMPGRYLYWGEADKLSSNALDSICGNAYKRHMAQANLFFLRRVPQTLSHSIFYTPVQARPLNSQMHLDYYQLDGFVPPPGYDEYIPDIIFGKDLLCHKDSSLGQWIFPLYGIMDLPFWVAWLIIGSFTIWYVALWWKERRFPTVAFYIASIVFCGYITMFIGAPYDWGRLGAPYYMLLFAAGGIMVTNVKKTLSGWWLKRRGFAQFGKVA